jgi:hypothetical protein
MALWVLNGGNEPRSGRLGKQKLREGHNDTGGLVEKN